MQVIFVFPRVIPPGPSRASLLWQGRVSTQKSTRLQRHSTLCDSTAPSHQCHVWPLEQRVYGHLEGKATLELPLALKVGGEGQLFVLERVQMINLSIDAKNRAISQLHGPFRKFTAWLEQKAFLGVSLGMESTADPTALA